MDANSDDPNFGNDIHDDPDFGDPNFDFAAFDHDPRDEVVQFMLGHTGTTSVEALVDLLRTQQLTSEQEAAERRAEVAARLTADDTQDVPLVETVHSDTADDIPDLEETFNYSRAMFVNPEPNPEDSETPDADADAEAPGDPFLDVSPTASDSGGAAAAAEPPVQSITGFGGGTTVQTPQPNTRIQLASTHVNKPLNSRRVSVLPPRRSSLSALTNGTVGTTATTFAHKNGLEQPFNVQTAAVPNYTSLSAIPTRRDYPKSSRYLLSPADKAKFFAGFTNKRVLAGDRKLAPLDLTTLLQTVGGLAPGKHSDPKLLHQLYNLSQQVERIREHLEIYDASEVFNCVQTVAQTPEGVLLDRSVTGTFHSIFTECIRLTPKMIELSTIWFLVWGGDGTRNEAEAFRDDVSYSLRFLQNNTDPKLWETCSHDLKKYHQAARGGPLMLGLILRRIHQTNAKAVSFVDASLRSFKITDVEGENVEQVVQIIEASIQVLLNATSPVTGGQLDFQTMTQAYYFPTDLPLVVLQIMQTSSVSEFNEVFEEIQQSCEREADKSDTPMAVEYPSVPRTLNTSLNVYRRLITTTSLWCRPTGTKPTALNAAPATFKLRCWNCEGDHHVKDCKAPRDEKRIAANRDKFNANRRNRFRSGNSNPNAPSGARTGSYNVRQVRTVDGKPEMLNKRGKWVPDNKQLARLKKQLDALAAVQADVTALKQQSGSSKTVAFQNPAPAPAPGPAPAPVAANAASTNSGLDAAWAKADASLTAALKAFKQP